jgi:hypothetical protein
MKKIYLLAWIMAGVMLGAILFNPPLLQAQGQQGSIEGTVRDPSGANIPDAKVTITNIRTNVSQTVTTSSYGQYTAPNLPPGIYRVTVEHTGFKRAIKENIRVVVGTASVVDVQLAVGTVGQTVTVAAQSTPVVSTTANLGTIITPKTISALPLEVAGSARQLDSFIFLTPGVTGNTFQSQVNGGPTFDQEILIDGLPWLNSDEGGSFLQFRPPFESIDEFKMQTNTYSAQYGRGTGIENYHLKSGTNQLHGDAFEFVRNTVLDARGFFAPTRGIEKQNEYGFTAGGPIYLPKIYDGRNKTFWNFTYEGFKFRGAIRTSLITLPQPAFLSGDFSQLKDASGNLIPIFDPATTRPDGHGGITRDPFPGNIIPPDRISTISEKFVPLIPTANLPGLINNALVGVPSAPPIDEGDWLLKVDHYIDAKNVLHGSLTRTSQSFPGASPQIPGPLGVFIEQIVPSWQGRITYDRIFSSNLINTLGVQYIRTVTFQIPKNLNQNLDTPISPIGASYPRFNIPGYVGFGTGSSESDAWIPGFGILDNVDWIRGRHTFHMGVDLRWQDETKLANTDWPGVYGFSTATTSLPDSPNFTIWGNGLASFLLGLPSSFIRQNIIGTHNYRTAYRAAYFQDDFRLTPKLTLNLGVRYDVPVGVTEKYDRMAFFDPNVTNPGAGNRLGAIVFAGNKGGPLVSQGGASLGYSRIANIDWKEVAPRFGFAYRLNDKTVLRGGYGLTYLPGGALFMWDGSTVSSYLTGFRTTQDIVSPDGGVTPALAWDQGIPPLVFPPFNRSVGNGQDVDYMGSDAGRAPYFQFWNLTVERQLPFQMGLQASYVGTKGTRVDANLENLNQVDPKYLSLGTLLSEDIYSADARAANIPIPYPGFQGSVAQALRPFPQYGFIHSNAQLTGNTRYDALQLSVQKYFSQGVSFLVNYVVSKTLDNTSNSFGAFNPFPVNTYDRKVEKAVSVFDMPQDLTASGTYELNLGPGKKFLNHGGVIGKIVGGWQPSWILNYHSGTPISIVGGPPLPLFNGGNRPNALPGTPTIAFRGGSFDPATDIYLNAAAWSQPCAFCIGNGPRTQPSTRTFPFYNEDLALIKTTPIKETMSIEFRAEFFNAFNRVIFGGPDGNLNDVLGFGRIGGQADIPRQIQFGLKFNF